MDGSVYLPMRMLVRSHTSLMRNSIILNTQLKSSGIRDMNLINLRMAGIRSIYFMGRAKRPLSDTYGDTAKLGWAAMFPS